MPPVVAIVVGLGLAFGAAPIGIGVFGSMFLFTTMVGTGLSMVVGGLSRAIRGRPDLGKITTQNNSVTVRQPISAGRVVYGTVGKLGGVLTYVETTGTKNEFLHMVITLSSHELGSIDTMYFDNVAVPLDGSGNATGTYAGFVHVEKNLGTRDQAAFSGLVSASAGLWTTAHRQRGRAGVYVRLKWDQNKFPHGVPNVTFDVNAGKKVRNTATGTIVATDDAALCLADYLIDSLGAVRRISLTAAMLSQSGLSAFTAANVCNGDYSDPAWHTDSAVPGAFLKVDLGAGNDKEVVEVRIVTQVPNSYAGIYQLDYSDNGTTWTTPVSGMLPDVKFNKFRVPFVGAHRYWRIQLTNTPGAGSWLSELELYESTVDKTQLVDAVTTCEESVSLAGGGTEKRYSINGVFQTDEGPSDVVSALVGAMAGDVVYEGGLFKIYPGKWRAPDSALDFDEDDLAGPLKVTTRQSRRDTFNSVRGTYIGAATNWQPSNFPTVTNPAYVSEDQGEQIFLDISLPFTSSNAAAQRISKIALEAARRQVVVNARFKLSAYGITAASVIKLSNIRFGWVQKTFKVVSCQLAAGNDGELFVDANLRETDANIYDWNPANDELTPVGASPISVTGLATCQAPTGLAAAASVAITPDGIRALIAALTWTAPADQFVTNGGRIHIFYKRHTDSGWSAAGAVAGDQVSFNLPGITSGVSYDYKLVAENTAGVFSADLILSNQTLTTSIAGVLIYRPTTNPLTASDAGSTATISIAAFTMRIKGVGDISVNSGSITGLSLNGVLYYVYYDDTQAAGGSVTFQATTTKEIALSAGARFFVGSIRTPADGGPDTVGFGDGGSSASIGMINFFSFKSATDNGTVSTKQKAIDGDTTTFADLSATANGTVQVRQLLLDGVPVSRRSYSALELWIDMEVPTNSLNGGAGSPRVLIAWGFTNGDPASGTMYSIGAGITDARMILKDALPITSNMEFLEVNIVTQTIAADTAGAVQAKIYDAKLMAKE